MPLDIPYGTETAGETITIDGRTYRPVLVDSSGRLLAVEAFDRIDISGYDGTVGDHVDTVRWTYTVPSSERGKMLWVLLSIDKLTTDEAAYIYLEHNPAGAAGSLLCLWFRGSNTKNAIYQVQPMFPFTPGDVFRLSTRNYDGADRRFVGNIAFAVQTI